MDTQKTTDLQGLEALLQKLGAEVPIPHFEDIASYPLANPIDIYRLYLTHAFSKTIECDTKGIYHALQRTNVLAKGDLALVLPRLGLRGRKIDELASEITSKLPKNPLFSDPAANGIYLPMYFSPTILPHFLLPYIIDRGITYGRNYSTGLNINVDGSSVQQKVVIEFSSPNIAKEFHAGHLRSTIIGAFIANLYQSMGWNVIKLNYLGDWGNQFGVLAVGWQRFGSEELFEADPLGHLLDVYVKINKLFKPEQDSSRVARDQGLDTAEIESKGLYAERNVFFKRMEDGEPDALQLWQRFRDVSIQRYIATYARLNITFDDYSGESQVKQATIKKVEQLLKEKGVSEEDDGSWIIDFKKHGAPNLATAVIRNRTRTTTYLLRDVAAVLDRVEKYGFNKMIYVVSTEQDMYFQRLIKTVELMGYGDIASKLHHINFGKVQGMSSRLGTVRLLSDILNECGMAMHELMKTNKTKYAQVQDPEAISDIIGTTAIMVQDMSGKRIHNYPFDIARMTSFEGDTGPYLQYTHARICSVMRKSGFNREDLVDADLSHLEGQRHAIDIMRLLAQWPDVVVLALKNHEPCTILTYLFSTAHQLSSSYDVIKVVGVAEGIEVSRARAALFEAARQVLENGMRLLGFTPVERM